MPRKSRGEFAAAVAMDNDLDTLALLLFTARHRSRRQAKRLLRDAGGAGTAAELDAMLAAIESHPARGDIEDHVQRLAEAALAADLREQEPAHVGGDHPKWLQCESIADARSFLLYIDTDCMFLAEIFDDAAECRETAVVATLDEGQVLGNVLWLDEPPPPERQAVLWVDARRELRIYDKRLGL